MSKVSLNAVRDLLLPGVWWRAGEAGVDDADLLVDHANDQITLITKSGNHVLVTRTEIEDNTFKSLVLPRLDSAFGTRK